jgi:hypothetical protein
MSATTGIYGASGNVSSFAIAEDSIFLKAISCIPIAGAICSLFQEISLSNRITQTADVPRLIELINLKNQYKTINAARNLLTAALNVTGIALGIIGGTFAFGAAITLVHVALAGLNIHQINQNNKAINELQTTGVKVGMQIS